jgi:hypothetical protein
LAVGLYAPAVLRPAAPRLRAFPFSAAHGPIELVIGEKRKKKREKKGYQEIFWLSEKSLPINNFSLNGHTPQRWVKSRRRVCLSNIFFALLTFN